MACSTLPPTSGTLTLSSASVVRVVAELKVSVPLVGGKVEHAIVSGLREHAGLETAVLNRWLAEAS